MSKKVTVAKPPIRKRSKTEGETPFQHIIRASGYSLGGLAAGLKYELSFRIEAALFVFLVPIALALPVSLMARGLVIGSMLIVLTAELLNSAMEWVVDYISLEKHPLAKRAKDMGSAAVFFALLNSGLFWLLAILEWGGIQ